MAARVDTATSSRLARLLVSEGLVAAGDMADATKEAERATRPLADVLRERQLASAELLVHAQAELAGIPYVNLRRARIDQDVLAALPAELAERFMAVPLAFISGRVAVAMVDAANVQTVDYLATVMQQSLKVCMASEASVRHVLAQYKTDLGAVDAAAEASQQETRQELASRVKTIVQDSPISRALSTILEYAAKTSASDIHIEPTEDKLVIRFRIDGLLRQVMDLPKSLEPALVSRVKILAELKIDEHRVPQDGQFGVKVADKEIDLRIAISPVIWGEQVVIRLLDKTGQNFDLSDMGLAGRSLRAVEQGIKRPSGMVLTSGPTGSGKTTTMYALLRAIKDESINIITLEDPVEYKMSGVNQIQVNTDVGLTFASGLRSILRQDPDVVMVGEIRDRETANLAVQAALTGHLVFSTLHTNNAAGVLPRLLDMGIEPFLIASTVNTVIGQRLVRRVAEQHTTRPATKLEARMISQTVGTILPQTSNQATIVAEDLGYHSLPLATGPEYQLAEGTDTPETPGGYSGRIGLYEVMTINQDIQKLITTRATSSEIEKLARAQGMVTMRQDGYLKAIDGITTLEEVNRVTV